LYKEDFYKFTQAYDEVMSFMKGEKPDYFVEPEFTEVEEEQYLKFLSGLVSAVKLLPFFIAV
jgi:hypothetical protein